MYREVDGTEVQTPEEPLKKQFIPGRCTNEEMVDFLNGPVLAEHEVRTNAKGGSG